MEWDLIRIFGPVVALENASQRTKNRVREHSLVPLNTSNGAAERKEIPNLGECILFACQECEWQGWLPTNEIGEA